MEGFVDMNSSQNYSVEESLKQVMLDHEIIFQKQVQELHRLYTVQKSLMKGATKCETFPIYHSVGSTRFVLQEDEDFCSTFQHRPLDLRLSTGDSSDSDEVNLSLSIGRSSNKRRNNWKKSKIDIIDLEESVENPNSTSTLFSMNSGNLQQDHLKINPPSMNGGMLSSNQGLEQTVAVGIDLNKDQPDESSFHSNQPLGPHPSSDHESSNRIGSTFSVPISKQPNSQTSAKDIPTKSCCIDLESLPEPSSDLSTEEEEIHISQVKDQKDEEDPDYTLQQAALSLVSISLQQTLTRNPDSETKTRSGSNEIGNNNKTPRSSIDSYESLVLKLEENSMDEDCATSKAFEINESDQTENRIKLKRGRRLKDFQKDILPTLSSLSRQEIWEDINILEGVIRSREYKRLQKGKTGKGEDWFTPVRSKRSKVNYVGPGRKKKSTPAEKLEL